MHLSTSRIRRLTRVRAFSLSRLSPASPAASCMRASSLSSSRIRSCKARFSVFWRRQAPMVVDELPDPYSEIGYHAFVRHILSEQVVFCLSKVGKRTHIRKFFSEPASSPPSSFRDGVSFRLGANEVSAARLSIGRKRSGRFRSASIVPPRSVRLRCIRFPSPAVCLRSSSASASAGFRLRARGCRASPAPSASALRVLRTSFPEAEPVPGTTA